MKLHLFRGKSSKSSIFGKFGVGVHDPHGGPLPSASRNLEETSAKWETAERATGFQGALETASSGRYN